MRRLPLPLLLVLVLAVAACGSRVDTSDASDDLGGEQGAEDEGNGGSDEELGPDSDMLGTIENPCSDDAPEGDLPADTPGVTEDTIRIGTISDRENPTVPLPTIGIQEAAEAFVEFCNEAGGINGRTIELVTYDSGITQTADVTKQACADDLFALVGSGSVQDQLGIEDREACGLPEVAAYSATVERAGSEDFFASVPGLSDTELNVGPCRWIAEQFPDAITKAAMVYTDLPAASDRGRQIVDACEEEAGFEFVVEASVPFGETNFGPLVSEMEAAGVRYFTGVSASSETLAALDAMADQGIELDVIDLGQQYYEDVVAESPAAEGAYVQSNTIPFTEAADSPMLRLYQRYLEQVDGKQSTLGVQGFSAGLLFATAAASLGNDLTREGLVEALEGITEWDGGGLTMPGNPADNQMSGCFLYMRVIDGEFVREFPDEGFECDPDNIVATVD